MEDIWSARRALGPRDPNKRVEGRRLQTYGKRGNSAAARAALKEAYFDFEEPKIFRTPEKVTNSLVDVELGAESLVADIKALDINKETRGPSVRQPETIIANESCERPARAHRSKALQNTGVVSSDIAPNDSISNYVEPLLKFSTNEKKVQRFDSWANHVSETFEITKRGGGSFGDVYGLKSRHPSKHLQRPKAEQNVLKALGGAVFKIIPINAQSGPGSRKFTSVENIAQEVRVLQAVDGIPGFTRFREVTVVSGPLPTSLVAAWTEYNESKERDRDDRSEKPPNSKLWAIVEMDDAGAELEDHEIRSIFEVNDVFWKTAFALAAAERDAAFEHRDLHFSNICIKSRRKDDSLGEGPTKLTEEEANSSNGLNYTGIEITLIDYTFSRANLPVAETMSCRPAAEYVAFCDLAKQEWLFEGTGKDAEEKLQRDTYRLMGEEISAAASAVSRKSSSSWALSVTRTNVVWLRFLLQALLRYRLKGRMIPGSDQHSTKLQKELFRRLGILEEQLDKTRGCEGRIESAMELVAWAEGQGWL